MNRALLIKASPFIFLLVIALGYGLYRTKDLIIGPKITVTTPQIGQTIATSTVTVAGQAAHIANLTLNDRQIFTDKTGQFTETLLAPLGYTIIKIEAKDRFGRRTTKLLPIVRL